MFTIFGATGNTGSVVASELLARGKRVRIVVRNAEKGAALRAKGAEVVIGDVLDAGSVATALEGAEGAYFLAPPDPTSTDLIGRARKIVEGYVGALARASVKHAVFLSSIAAHEPSGTGPIVITHQAEKALSAVKGTAFTFIRAAYFMENILANAYPMKKDGVLPVFGGGEGYPFPMIATHDIGLVAADALVRAPSTTEIIELSGPKEYSMVDAANEATRILGRQVTATPLPIEQMVPTLTSFGLSENVASLYREMTAAIGAGLVKFDGKGTALRGKVTLGEVLEALRH